ncbi:unnamed protein product, partial [marine sediment metagenome]
GAIHDADMQWLRCALLEEWRSCITDYTLFVAEPKPASYSRVIQRIKAYALGHS